MLPFIDRIGGEMAYNHYPTGWAQVSNTPLKWYKKHVHGGGVRAPLILHWPGHIQEPGKIRHQYHHVTDLAPTVYDVLKVSAPEMFEGVPQLPIHGTPLTYTFEAPQAPTRKQSQIFELLGDRAIWSGGWKAVAHHTKGNDFERDVWELYKLDDDFAEINDLAASRQDKLKELLDLWWQQAKDFNVLPLDDRDWERAAERLKMMPTLEYEFHAGMSRIDRLTSPDITDRSYRITATFEVPQATPQGVVLAWGSHVRRFCALPEGRQGLLRIRLFGVCDPRDTGRLEFHRGAGPNWNCLSRALARMPFAPALARMAANSAAWLFPRPGRHTAPQPA